MLAATEEIDTEDDLRVALDAADRAVAIAPDLPELRSLRGWMRTVFAWDWAGAKDDLERARALAPGDAPTQSHYAHLLATLGRPAQAIPIARDATELDPLSADAWWYLASYYNATDQLGLAEAALLRARSFAPTHARVARELGFTYLMQGRPAEALQLFEAHGVGCMRFLGAVIAQHELGREDASRDALERLVARHARTSAYQIAQAYAWLGDLDSSFAWLDRSQANRDPGLHYVKYDALLRNLRGDPRYGALLRRMRLPVD
jgi:tetratricopeptide (TPR) repeat protein